MNNNPVRASACAGLFLFLAKYLTGSCQFFAWLKVTQNCPVRGLSFFVERLYHRIMKENEQRPVEQTDDERLIRMIIDYDDRREYVD